MINPETIDVDSSDTESCVSSASSSSFDYDIEANFEGFLLSENEPLATYCFIALRSIILRYLTTDQEYSGPKYIQYLNHLFTIENQQASDAVRLHSAKMLIYALTQHITALESSQ